MQMENGFVPTFFKIRDAFRIDYFENNLIDSAGPHKHDFYEILFIINDNVAYFAENVEYKVRSTDLLLIPPGVEHYPVIVRGNQPAVRYVLWLRKDYLDSLCSEQSDLSMCFSERDKLRLLTPMPEQYQSLLSTFEQLYQNHGSEDFGSDILDRAYIEKILVDMNRSVLGSAARLCASGTGSNPLIQSVIRYILQNFQSDMSLQQMADHFYVNKYYLCRCFKASTGISPYAYIIEQRLKYARLLISRQISLTDVARLSGFSDYTSFYRQYVKHYGMRPGSTDVDFHAFNEADEKTWLRE